MNQRLVPTRIVNKNGVTTTVHKKPQPASASSSAFPAPSSSLHGYLLTDDEAQHKREADETTKRQVSALISLIMEQPEESEEITRIIIKDRITDSELIRARITSESQSLREGII